MIDPRSFRAEYVQPAIACWQANQNVKHLAVHAITQVDVLAEIVALWKSQKVSQFRDQLGVREPILAIIRDAHDSHKHGMLGRGNATHVSLGQRPEQVPKHAFFVGETFLGGPLTPYDELVLVLNNGTDKSIFVLLHEAMEAWERELIWLGL